MQLSPPSAIAWMERLLALSLTLQTIELLHARDALRDDATFRWATLRRDFDGVPTLRRALLDPWLAYRPFCALLVVQLGAALLLPWSRSPALALVLVATTLLGCLRFRGAFQGGSDAMTMVVLVGVVAARLGSAHPWVAQASLGYVAAQLVLSYFVAGIAKLRDPSWRQGHALARLAQLPQYAVPAGLARVLMLPWVGRLGAFAVLTLECAFPLALVSRATCIALLALALLFHLANVALLGLNRFLWAWLAAYPALLYWSDG